MGSLSCPEPPPQGNADDDPWIDCGTANDFRRRVRYHPPGFAWPQPDPSAGNVRTGLAAWNRSHFPPVVARRNAPVGFDVATGRDCDRAWAGRRGLHFHETPAGAAGLGDP